LRINILFIATQPPNRNLYIPYILPGAIQGLGRNTFFPEAWGGFLRNYGEHDVLLLILFIRHTAKLVSEPALFWAGFFSYIQFRRQCRLLGI
jgi:hypothetical protein